MKYQIFLTRTIFIFYTLLAVVNSFANSEVVQNYEVKNILLLKINDPITSVTADYIEYQQKHIKHDLVIIQMNTPGGLLSSTKSIVQSLLNNKKPLITWIGPDGASASSAGAIIASASQKIYMSHASNIGAATPISIFGDFEKESDLKKKIIEDTSAYIRSLCDINFRDPKLFEEMVTLAKSFTASEALHAGIIDGYAQSLDDLILEINSKEINIGGIKYLLNLNENRIITHTQFDFGQTILSILSDPNIIFGMLILGLVLIYVELQAPGGYVAGAIGAISIILFSIGMQIIPINFAALLLFLLSGILFFLEIYVTSFGLLFIGATTSAILGALFLFRTNDSMISVSLGMIISILSLAIGLGSLLVYFIIKNRKNIGAESFNELLGATGHILGQEGDGIYMAKIGSEIWKCHATNDLKTGDKIIVVCKNENLTLEIKLNPTKE